MQYRSSQRHYRKTATVGFLSLKFLDYVSWKQSSLIEVLCLVPNKKCSSRRRRTWKILWIHLQFTGQLKDENETSTADRKCFKQTCCDGLQHPRRMRHPFLVHSLVKYKYNWRWKGSWWLISRWFSYLLTCGGFRHVMLVPVPLRDIDGTRSLGFKSIW